VLDLYLEVDDFAAPDRAVGNELRDADDRSSDLVGFPQRPSWRAPDSRRNRDRRSRREAPMAAAGIVTVQVRDVDRRRG
jgi:hypothetical protein